MDNDSALRLLIVEEDINEAESLVSAIKAAGFGVRVRRVEDLNSLPEDFEQHAPDVVLHSVDHPSIGLEMSIDSARQTGQHIPVIALAGADADVVQCMQLGAHDLVSKENKEHLRLVIDRASESRRTWLSSGNYAAALEESEKRCRTLLDSSKDPICYVHEGMHVYANDTYLETFGYTSFEDVEGMPFMDLVDPEDQKDIKNFLRVLSKGGEQTTPISIRLTDESGGIFSADLNFSNASIDGEPCAQIVIRTGNNTEDLEKQIVQLSQRDPVTGLLNRKFFLSRLDEAVEEAVERKGVYTLALIQITNIQEIRQIVGVAGFDTVIAEFAKRLDTMGQRPESSGRFSDDSLCIICELSDLSSLEEWMRRLWEDLSGKQIETDSFTISTVPAIGVAKIDYNTPETNELVLRAEAALDQARQAPAPHVAVYTPQKGEMSQRELDAHWAEQIQWAQKEGRIRAVFQPIVSLHGDPGERYELFLRLLDPQGELISANKFIPSAERTGIACRLDRYLIEYAAKQIQAAQASGRTVTLFIKLSAGALQDADMGTWLSDAIRENGLRSGSLVFELKEVTLVTHLKQARVLSDLLHQLKCGLAIDDFGTGLKPFQLLKAISVDYLKIDEGIMDQIATDTERQDELKTITATAQDDKKLVVAPFVENAATLSILWEIGVNYIQGNFLEEPSEDMDYDFSAFG